MPAQIASEPQARQGHDLLQYTATLSQFEPVSSTSPTSPRKEQQYGEQLAICRVQLQPEHRQVLRVRACGSRTGATSAAACGSRSGSRARPPTLDELLKGASEIKKGKNVQLGLGMSQEIDSNMAAHALLWSFGVHPGQERTRGPELPETIAAVEFMQRLYQGSMTPEVFSWNAASNNQGLVAGKLSYILNSISAWRTSQEVDPQIAEDVFFTKALRGPKDARAAQHVLYNYIIPTHATNPDAAKEFLLHYTDNWAPATYHSKLYDFPSWSKARPRPRSVARERPVRGEARRQVGVPRGCGAGRRVEREHRPSRTLEPGHR